MSTDANPAEASADATQSDGVERTAQADDSTKSLAAKEAATQSESISTPPDSPDWSDPDVQTIVCSLDKSLMGVGEAVGGDKDAQLAHLETVYQRAVEGKGCLERTAMDCYYEYAKYAINCGCAAFAAPPTLIGRDQDHPDLTCIEKAILSYAKQKEKAAKKAAKKARQREAREKVNASTPTPDLEHTERIRRHDEREAMEAAALRVSELERRAQIARDRAARAGKPEPPLPTPGPSHKPPQSRERSRQMTRGEEIEHAAFLQRDRVVLADAFNARQEVAHLEAEARKARAEQERLKLIISEREKAEALRAQVLPPPPSVDECFEQLRVD